MSKFAGFMLFVAGAGIGAITTWYFAKRKYEEITQEEIASVKEAYSRNLQEQADEAKAHYEYANIINSSGYISNENNKSEPEKDQTYSDITAPYIITPDDFSVNYDYETIDITYYADGIFTDENDEKVEDIAGTIGIGTEKHFGEYDPDAVYVRNDRLKCDYEILRDERTYSEVIKNKPNRTGVGDD